MSGGLLVGLESLLFLGLFFGFCWHQFRVLNRDKAEREARLSAARAAKKQ